MHEELVERKVTLLAVNFSKTALKDVVGVITETFDKLTKHDVGTKATIHRGCMIVFFIKPTTAAINLTWT